MATSYESPTDQYCAAAYGGRDSPPMPTPIEGAPHQPGRRRWASLILRDVQFWIPVAVLIGGLLALRWVS